MNLSGWNRISTSVLTIAALTFAVGACDKLGGGGKKKEGNGTGTAGSGSQPVANDKGDIVIGHYASLTGAEATFGQSTDHGVVLALEERNAAGGVKGRKIVLKTLDDASKATEAGNVVQRLISDDKVVAIIGEVASGSSLAGGKVAQQFGVPMISPSSTNKKVTEGRDMVSRVCFLDEFQGYVGAKFSKDYLKISKVAVLYDQAAPYSKGLAETFSAEFTGMGGTITTSQAYTAGDADVAAQLQSIKTSGAEAVYLPGYYTDVGNIVRQARKIGITVPFLGGDGWDSAKLAEIGGEAIEGSYYSNHYSFDEERPVVQEFVARYQKRWGGETPDGLAALGYDAANVLFDAMERAPSLSGKDLAASIAATKDFAGVTGKITLDANRDAQKQAVMVQMKGGKPRYVATIVPKGMPEPAPQQGSAAGSAAAKPADGSAAAGSAAAPTAAPAK
ncbi:MAG: ABC transporter substrate-binding protein [Kofleriaceae bacterium]|nr:ABC transporter substrate-binding protein [Kofleriaceae bacterium]